MTTTCSDQLGDFAQNSDRGCSRPLTISPWGTRKRAADRLASARPKERPATDVMNPWRRDGKSNALNWQPGAAALLQGPQKTSNAIRRDQRLAHETGARQNEWSRSRRTLVLQRMGAEAQSEASGCPILFSKMEAA